MVSTCDAFSRVRHGMCGRPLDKHGLCDRASDHVGSDEVVDVPLKRLGKRTGE